MHFLKIEVVQALTKLAKRQAPPEGEPLFEFVQQALGGIDVEVSRVERVSKGQFLAKWHRKGGVLTEETLFTLIEPAFVRSWA